MTDDPLPDEDEDDLRAYLQAKDEILREQVRLEVAKVMIPVCGQEGFIEMAHNLDRPHTGLRTTLDWWVDWITGELEEESK